MDLDRILNHDPTHYKPARQCMMATSSKCLPLRVGKWTTEEEAFALELIRTFLAGTLNIPEGTSLRLFLAKKLYCSPMRVTTKLSTNVLYGQHIRKRLGQLRYFPSTSSSCSSYSGLHTLEDLESRFRSRENIPVECTKDETYRQNCDNIGGENNKLATKSPVRIGTWTNEEEVYAFALINAFRSGTLNITPGTTLRCFLAEQLCCDRMRITKKLSYGVVAQYRIPSRLGCLRYRPVRQINSSNTLHTTEDLAVLRKMCFSLNQATIASSSKRFAAPHSPCSATKRARKEYESYLASIDLPKHTTETLLK